MSTDDTPPRLWWSPSRAKFVIVADPILPDKPFVGFPGRRVVGDLAVLPADAVELRPVAPAELRVENLDPVQLVALHAAVQDSLIVKGVGITDPAAICVPSTDLAAERERWACWFDSCADHADDMTDGERSGMRHAAIHMRDDLVIERVRKIPLAARSLSIGEAWAEVCADERVQAAAQVLHNRRHPLGTASSCGRCVADARAVAVVFLSGPDLTSGGRT